MDANEDIEDTFSPDEHETSWASSNFTPYEQECLQEVENTSGDLEIKYQSERDVSSHKLWLTFESAACCIAQLHKDRHQGVSQWNSFQNAAGSATTLYKEGIESQKRIGELGLLVGSQRRNKELLSWLKKRKRSHIRRDEVIAFLSGRTKPVRNSSLTWSANSRQRHSMSPDVTGATAAAASPSLHNMRTPSHHNITLTCLSLTDPPTNLSNCEPNSGDLQTFRDALSVAGIRNSPQSSFTPNPPTSYNRRTCTGRSAMSAGGVNSMLTNTSIAELNAFITEEFNRREKRSASAADVIMDSPTHKKTKFL